MNKKKINIINLLFIIVFFLSSNNKANCTNNDMNNFLKELENDANIINENNLIRNQPSDRFVEKIKLHGLNKITGKTSTIEAVIGDVIEFEQLEIIPLKCWKSYPEENTENKLLLKVFEKDIKTNAKKLIFYGWFFSSSPSVSGLEHPLYDLKLLNCEKLENITNN